MEILEQIDEQILSLMNRSEMLIVGSEIQEEPASDVPARVLLYLRRENRDGLITYPRSFDVRMSDGGIVSIPVSYEVSGPFVIS